MQAASCTEMPSRHARAHTSAASIALPASRSGICSVLPVPAAWRNSNDPLGSWHAARRGWDSTSKPGGDRWGHPGGNSVAWKGNVFLSAQAC